MSHDGPVGMALRPDYHRQLIAVGRTNGLAAVGFAAADPFAGTLAELRRRAALGLHDGMSFTYRNPQRSTDAAATLTDVKSLVVAALAYPGPTLDPEVEQGWATDETKPAKLVSGRNSSPVVAGRVAAYACDDYYGALRAGLDKIADRLRQDGHRCIVVADQNALVDREAAVRAGLGWYGKSSNVLLPRAGSYFVLGSVLTTAALAPSEPAAEGCGSCRRCLDGCPTGAIIEPGVVDAARCLAWLVQKTGPFPRQYRHALGNRLYGCDDCQEVCPPNRRAVSLAPSGFADVEIEVGAEVGVEVGVEGEVSDPSVVDVLGLLEATDDEILDRHGRWYIPERDPRWVRRNALIVLGNSGVEPSSRVDKLLSLYLASDDAMLRAQALWSARELGRIALVGHLEADDDPVVAEEWSAGLVR